VAGDGKFTAKNKASVHTVGNVEFLKPPLNVACLRGFASDSVKAACNHKFIQLIGETEPLYFAVLLVLLSGSACSS
jgi:hypothetical protein